MLFFFFFFCFLGPFPRHMNVPRLGVTFKLQPLAYTTATATPDPSVCDLHQSSQRRWLPDPLSEARDGTIILTDTSWIRFHCATAGTLPFSFLSFFLGAGVVSRPGIKPEPQQCQRQILNPLSHTGILPSVNKCVSVYRAGIYILTGCGSHRLTEM